MSLPRAWTASISSSVNPRQRMFGSSPRISTRSVSDFGGRATDRRVVGHEIFREAPSVPLTVGRFTWKS